MRVVRTIGIWLALLGSSAAAAQSAQPAPPESAGGVVGPYAVVGAHESFGAFGAFGTDDAMRRARSSQELLTEFEGRFAVMDSVLFRLPSNRIETFDVTVTDRERNERIAAIDELVEANIRAMKARTGLDLRGQTYVRPGRNLSYDPDDPLVAYNAKVQVELEWNIFHSSIYKRASKIRELRLQGEISQLEHERDALEELLFLQKMQTRYHYYGRLLTVLNLHSENLKLLMETQLYLLQHGKISSDDLLKLISEQAEIERQLIAIKTDSVVTELPAYVSASCVSIADTAAFMECIRSEQRDLRKLSLRKELLEVQRKNINYLQTMDILPFARYSYYNRENVRNTYNIDVGVSFKIPLSGETARKRRALRAEQRVVDYEMEQIEPQVNREVVALLRELDNFNENIYGEFRRMTSLKEYIRMRLDSYANVAGEYSRLDRLQEYNAYLQAWERMLAYTYQRDCQLIDLQTYLTEAPIGQFLRYDDLYE